MQKQYYDLTKIREIPIQDVCQSLGIQVQNRGGRYWCKLRDERTASTILHPEKNTFHDFGSGQHGDAIDMVSTVLGVGKGDAIRFLADTFHIAPEAEKQRETGLNDWEYRQIGLAGDLATKNMDFDLTRQSVEEVTQLSQRYGISMNDLRRQYPRVYEQLLRNKAVPYVKQQRYDYYLEVYTQGRLTKAVGAEQLFNSQQIQDTLSARISQLQRAEGILRRACENTSIRAYPVGHYEPTEDLRRIQSGEIKIPLGEHTYWEMNKIAEEHHTAVKYRTVDIGAYLSGKLDGFTHSAFLKQDAVIVGYLESDYRQIKPVLDTMRSREKERQPPSVPTLDELVADAQKQISQQQSKPPARMPDMGLER